LWDNYIYFAKFLSLGLLRAIISRKKAGYTWLEAGEVKMIMVTGEVKVKEPLA
jgi:hypothetical protein